MTILEDLKSGRLVVVPGEALADLCNAVMADISEAKRRLDADIPKDAPVHPVSAFLTGTALHIGKARASPDHTAGLIALVEGMEAERDRLKVEQDGPLLGWAFEFLGHDGGWGRAFAFLDQGKPANGTGAIVRNVVPVRRAT